MGDQHNWHARQRWLALKNATSVSDIQTRHPTSSATSNVTSRHEPSAILKAMMQTGLGYSPESRLRITVFAICGVSVGLPPRLTQPRSEVTQHDVGVLIRPVGSDGWRGTHDRFVDGFLPRKFTQTASAGGVPTRRLPRPSTSDKVCSSV